MPQTTVTKAQVQQVIESFQDCDIIGGGEYSRRPLTHRYAAVISALDGLQRAVGVANEADINRSVNTIKGLSAVSFPQNLNNETQQTACAGLLALMQEYDPGYEIPQPPHVTAPAMPAAALTWSVEHKAGGEVEVKEDVPGAPSYQSM